MLNMFGRDYEEIGSSSKGLILKNSGKVKIQWGKKLIDLLDLDGNLNVKIKTLIKLVSSESDITSDGFYFYNGNLVAKVGNNILELVSQSGTSYVSFLIELDTTDELKYTALKNIGFVYKSIKDSNIYPKNGIIYVEDSLSLFIVKDGVLSKYSVSIPNPYTKLFVIHKEDDEEGALVIEGIGVENSLKFNSLKIYSEGFNSVFEAEKEYKFKIHNKLVVNISLTGIKADGIESFDANDELGYRIYRDNGKYILEIDKIKVREPDEEEELRFDYLDTKIYSERYIIDSAKIETDLYDPSNRLNFVYNERFIVNTSTSPYTETYNIHYIDDIKITTVGDTNFLAGLSGTKTFTTLIQVPLRVIKCVFLPEVSLNYIRLNEDEENHTYDEIRGYLDPIYNLTYSTVTRPKIEVINVNFETTSVNGTIKYKFLNLGLHVMMLDLLPYLSIEGEMREFIKLCDYDSSDKNYTTSFYVIDGPSLQEMLLNHTMYITSDESTTSSYTKSRILYDFENSEISLLLNNNNIRKLTHSSNPHEFDIHFKVGNISNFKVGLQDTNRYGMFSDSNVFIGAEFRHPLPIKAEEQMQFTQNYNVILKEVASTIRDFPRYSTRLCNDANKFITNDNIILPRKYALKVTIEDFTAVTSISDTISDISYDPINIYLLSTTADDTVLYSGKLILLKLNGQAGQNSYVKILKTTVTQAGREGYVTTIDPLYYPIKMNNNLIVEGTDYDDGTVLLLKFNNALFNYLCGNLKKSGFSPGDLTGYTRDVRGNDIYYYTDDSVSFGPDEYYFFRINGSSNTTLIIETADATYDTDIVESYYEYQSTILLKTIDVNGDIKFIYWLGNKNVTTAEVKTLLQDLCTATGVTYNSLII